MVAITVSIGIEPIIGLNNNECNIKGDGVNSVRIAINNCINLCSLWTIFDIILSIEICNKESANSAWSSSSKSSVLHNMTFSIISTPLESKFKCLICLVVFLNTGNRWPTSGTQLDTWRRNSGAQSWPTFDGIET